MQLALVLLDAKSKFLEGNRLKCLSSLGRKFKDELNLIYVIRDDYTKLCFAAWTFAKPKYE